jgi:uncharacterized membrane protein
MKDAEIYAGALLMGAVAGMRSMAAPAMIGQFANSGLLSMGDSPLAFMTGPKAGVTTAILAAGEFIADKLPFVPKRTKPGPLAARAISGGLSGAAFCSANKRPLGWGILLGAAGAIGAAYAAYELRARAGDRFGVPDPAVAMLEDAVIAGAGILVTSRLRATNRIAS